jgi:hypothetical protein
VDNRENLTSAEAHVEEMYLTGALDAASYYKCLVTLAHDWLCTHFDMEQTLILLNKCPPEYFKKDLLNQLKDDTFFAEAAMVLVYKLVQLGVSNQSPLKINQPEATA